MLLRKHRRKNREGSWAVSYVDMLTLLLCFFIIFFKAEKIDASNPFLAQVTLGLKGELVGVESQRGAVSASAGGIMREVQKSLENYSGVQGRATESAIHVDFAGTSFFDSGSVRITESGSARVNALIEKLQPFRDKIRIKVQGHTDSRPVVRKGKASDNWELSVLRATSVLKVFIESGFSPGQLAAEGFAENRSRVVAAQSEAERRRVSLTIEEWQP